MAYIAYKYRLDWIHLHRMNLNLRTELHKYTLYVLTAPSAQSLYPRAGGYPKVIRSLSDILRITIGQGTV